MIVDYQIIGDYHGLMNEGSNQDRCNRSSRLI